jgi:CPA1 family monovalent cation:H+ antiporter
LALALRLHAGLPYRDEILTMTFGVVAFPLIVQGLTLKPLPRPLRIEGMREAEYDIAKARNAPFSASRQELDFILRDHMISQSTYKKLRGSIDASKMATERALAEMQEKDAAIASDEMRLAMARLAAVEKSSIQCSANQGLISMHVAEQFVADAGAPLDTETPRAEIPKTDKGEPQAP